MAHGFGLLRSPVMEDDPGPPMSGVGAELGPRPEAIWSGAGREAFSGGGGRAFSVDGGLWGLLEVLGLLSGLSLDLIVLLFTQEEEEKEEPPRAAGRNTGGKQEVLC